MSELDTVGWSMGSNATASLVRLIYPLGAAVPTGSVGFGAEHRFSSTSSPLTLPEARKLMPKAGRSLLRVPRLVSGKAGDS